MFGQKTARFISRNLGGFFEGAEIPKDFQIRRFLIKNRAEVKNMCLTEYNEAETMQMFKEEGRDAIELAFLCGPPFLCKLWYYSFVTSFCMR